MEGLKTLIRNLAFILLLATFLEMLLPNKAMRGFVQLVMGLFVLAAILNPLASFLRSDFTEEVPAWIAVSSRDQPVLASEGTPLGEDTGKSVVREQYKRILANQIRTLVATVDEVASSEIKIELESEAGGFSDYPNIAKVEIVFTTKQYGVTPISPVIIGEEGVKQDKKLTGKALEIRDQVATLMQISKEIISVVEKK